MTDENKGFSGWWNKTKASVNSSILENNLEGQFNKDNASTFTIYTKGEMFSSSCHGKLENEELTVYGAKEVKPNTIIVAKENNKAYYVIGTEPTKTKVSYEGNVYEKDATIIKLDSNVEEVNVIKAGDRYFKVKEQ